MGTDIPSMVSYAQNREDVLLDRVFKGVATGFYIDIGAFDSTMGSVTKTFYDRGWSGVNVEPGPIFDELARERPRDINVKAVVTDQEGEVDFFEDLVDPGMSKVAGESSVAESGGHSVRVRAVTLNSLVAQYAGGREINFLKIDAEGSEAAIVKSTDWISFRPLVLIIEATAPWSNELVNQDWEPTLLANNYLRAYFDGINVFYVRAESSDLLGHFQRPVNVLDNYTTLERLQANQAVNNLGAEMSAIIAERDRLSGECETLRQQAVEVQKQLKAAIEQGNSERRGLADHIEELSAQLVQEQDQADISAKQLAASVAALSEQLSQMQAQAQEGQRLAAHTAALSGQLAQERDALALAASRASRYDRLVLELRDEGGPRALKSVLPLARFVRRLHTPAVRNNSIDRGPATSVDKSHTAPGASRAALKKGVFGFYKVLFRPVVRPAMWRLRTFLLQPVFERLDSQRGPYGSADIEALRQDQAQLTKSLEMLALTIASNPAARNFD